MFDAASYLECCRRVFQKTNLFTVNQTQGLNGWNWLEGSVMNCNMHVSWFQPELTFAAGRRSISRIWGVFLYHHTPHTGAASFSGWLQCEARWCWALHGENLHLSVLHTLLLLLLLLLFFLISLLFPVHCSYLHLWSLTFGHPILLSIWHRGNWVESGWVAWGLECFQWEHWIREYHS